MAGGPPAKDELTHTTDNNILHVQCTITIH